MPSTDALVSIVTSYVSPVLGIVSLVLAYVSIRAARSFSDEYRGSARNSTKQLAKVVEDVQEVVNHLTVMEQQLSTVRIGSFPEHVAAIAEFLVGAKRTIYIACQAVGYGVSSAPRAYSEYNQAIRTRALEGVSVFMLSPSEDLMDRARNLQFGSGVEWDARMEDPRFNSIVVGLASRLRRDLPIQGFEEFKAALAEENDRCVKELEPYATIKYLDEWVPIQMWIVDGEAAVFAFTSGVGSTRGVAFKTTDVAIASSLTEVWRFYSVQ